MTPDALNELIRQTAAELAGHELEVGKIADVVCDRIDPADAGDALRLVMALQVRHVIRAHRQAVLATPPENPTPAATAPVAAGRSRRSIRVQAWQAKLDVMVAIERRGTMKRLGDCTVDDLRQLVDHYKAAARQSSIHAAWYARLADALAESSARTLDRLPQHTLRDLFGESAA